MEALAAVSSHAQNDSSGVRRLLIVAALALVVAVLGGEPQVLLASHISLPAVLNTNAASDSADDRDPRLATDGVGNWVAVWDGPGGTSVARSSDNGQTWSAPVVPLSYTRPEVANDGQGNWVILAVSGTSVLPSFSTDNGATWITGPVLDSTSSSTSARLHVAAGGGVFMAAWESADVPPDIRYARSTNGGVTWSPAAYLNTDPQTSRSDTLPSLAADGGTGWVAVWQAFNGSSTYVYRARSVDGGLSWSAPDYVVSGERPSVALSGAGVAVVVYQGEELYSVQSANGGLTWSVGALVSGSFDGASDFGATVTVDATGNFLATWAAANPFGGALGTDGDMLAAYSTDGGVSWTGPGVLNTNAITDTAADGSSSLQARGGVATGGAGSWIAAWSSSGGTYGSDSDILYTDCLPVGNDSDADAVGNQCDNCPAVSNATQRDFDGDGLGDLCDEDQDADGVCEVSVPPGSPSCTGVDACPNTPAAAPVTPGGCSDADLDPDSDGWCTPLGLPSGPSGCLGSDNCPLAANPGQEDTNGNGVGDVCEAPGAPGDSDGDGWQDAAEAGMPLCSNTMNDDYKDDGLTNDGCPASGTAESNCGNTTDDDGDGRVNDGCPRSGQFAEGQFTIGTDIFGRCGVGPIAPSPAWPADLSAAGGGDGFIRLSDITSFTTPSTSRKFNTSPGDASFDARWDLVPGVMGPGYAMIALNDITAITSGPTGRPPMFGGARAWHYFLGCSAHPVYGD